MFHVSFESLMSRKFVTDKPDLMSEENLIKKILEEPKGYFIPENKQLSFLQNPVARVLGEPEEYFGFTKKQNKRLNDIIDLSESGGRYKKRYLIVYGSSKSGYSSCYLPFVNQKQLTKILEKDKINGKVISGIVKDSNFIPDEPITLDDGSVVFNFPITTQNSVFLFD